MTALVKEGVAVAVRVTVLQAGPVVRANPGLLQLPDAVSRELVFAGDVVVAYFGVTNDDAPAREEAAVGPRRLADPFRRVHQA